MSKRKPGAQPGNHNALKHGFYSSAFTQHERRLLTQLPNIDLAGEIELIRIANRRFLHALQEDGLPLDVDSQLAALRAVNLSAQSITGLLRAQALLSLTASDPRLADALNLVPSLPSASSATDSSHASTHPGPKAAAD